ncbi:MAG: rod shape-determining protein MreC [Bacteroidota bacterium]
MRKLLNFLYQNRSLLLFLLLEAACVVMIVNSHRYQGAQYFNSSARVTAGFLDISQRTATYFNLREANDQLAMENALLREQLTRLQQSAPLPSDSGVVKPYDFMHARVVSNSTAQSRNYITIDRGTEDGIEPGMAVIGQSGIVGKVKAVSTHYAVVISLLNIDEHVSAAIKRTGNFGTVNWNGSEARIVQLEYIPRHASVWKGDSVVTSGYNAIFPPGLPVGVVKEVRLSDEAMFHEVSVELSQDFTRLQFVYVIRSRNKPEIDSVQQKVLNR